MVHSHAACATHLRPDCMCHLEEHAYPMLWCSHSSAFLVFSVHTGVQYLPIRPPSTDYDRPAVYGSRTRFTYVGLSTSSTGTNGRAPGCTKLGLLQNGPLAVHSAAPSPLDARRGLCLRESPSAPSTRSTYLQPFVQWYPNNCTSSLLPPQYHSGMYSRVPHVGTRTGHVVCRACRTSKPRQRNQTQHALTACRQTRTCPHESRSRPLFPEFVCFAFGHSWFQHTQHGRCPAPWLQARGLVLSPIDEAPKPCTLTCPHFYFEFLADPHPSPSYSSIHYATRLRALRECSGLSVSAKRNQCLYFGHGAPSTLS
eukprot:NODE_597_length_1781_cov_42.665054_g587_i0.p1 GENE.NODE_597_length_1781_cov_42.665054_g587_i0~~NODE_597_length_1781_cov_42.665054_g587_i0.p1  ORF type:complete len:312 (-),score=-26.34 NODE_597_length_1781_cov_42.665054_g587_i0:721-1656(-)